MESSTLFLLLADAILFLHVLLVVFVVFGLVLIYVGKARRWFWVRNPWFRVMHLLVIAMVTIQSWLGVICPLTAIEMALRSRAGDAIYRGSFITHWLETILYLQLPPWVFTVSYTVLGAVVIGSWFWVAPRPFRDHFPSD
ncbi:MAG: DUF2784 domain-containing protein [Pseudomonadota bacterium]|nr:DUF2784 domain-containing protein [Pseudomonadota bacterium]